LRLPDNESEKRKRLKTAKNSQQQQVHSQECTIKSAPSSEH
jgi:hypothetical protein